MNPERDWTALAASVAGVIGAKVIDLLIQRVRQAEHREETAAERMERESTQFRQDLMEQVKTLRVDVERVETENRRLDQELIDLRRQLMEERWEKDVAKRENAQLRQRVQELEAQVTVLQQAQIDVAKRQVEAEKE